MQGGGGVGVTRGASRIQDPAQDPRYSAKMELDFESVYKMSRTTRKYPVIIEPDSC